MQPDDSGAAPAEDAAIDAELSEAITAYLPGVFAIRRHPENLAALPGPRSAAELEEIIGGILGEMYAVPGLRRAGTVWDECRLIHETVVPRHPELSKAAVDALLMHYAWANR